MEQFLPKIFSPILKFIGIVASSLTGISAVCTVVGFLAERSHLFMLGFISMPVDLNQYMYPARASLPFLPIVLLLVIVQFGALFQLANTSGIRDLLFMPKYCRVNESDESNNASVAVTVYLP